MCSRIPKRHSLFLFSFLVSVACWSQESKSFSATSDELLGLWSGEGEVIEFRSDGKARYAGELYSYELSQGHLLIETASGKVVFAYTIRDGKLVLTTEGQRSVYTRMTSGAQQETRKDQNPADLLGQWCYIKNSTGPYSGRCITLRGDGTYVFQDKATPSGTDEGRWYVQGDKLYYQSATKGHGSYKLERRNHPINKNEPMIVLNDEPFVTTVSRPPWK